MRRRLARLAVAAAALLAAAAFAVALFLTRPEVFLNDRTAAAAARYFGAAWAPRWTSLRFTASALAPGRHRYELYAAGLCVAESGGLFSGCLERLELSVVASYSARGAAVERVERLVALVQTARLDLRRLPEKRAPRPPPAALRGTAVDSLRVELPDLTVLSSRPALSGALRASLTPGIRRPLSVSAELRGLPGAPRRVSARLTADTDLFRGGAPTFVDALGRVDLGRLGRAEGALRVVRAPDRYEGTGELGFAASTGPVRGLRLADCRGAAPRRGSLRLSRGDAACRFEVSLAEAAEGRLGGVKAAAGTLKLNARIENERFTAIITAGLDPLAAAWYELSGTAEARLAGRLGGPLKELAASHDARLEAKVPRFEELVARLRGTRFAVPAPVHALKGPLRLVVESRGDPRADRQRFRYALTSELAGARQRLFARTTGDLTVSAARAPARAFVHEGEVLLREVALELPRLEIGRAPKVVADKRIKTGDETPAPAEAAPAARRTPPVRSLVAVRTEKPLVLFSNLAKDPVPVALDLLVAYPPPAAGGTVSVRAFDVELFRRNATIDHLNVTLSSGSTVGVLEGLVKYEAPGARIRIRLLGTTERPRVELESDPPLKREDIIALLIFGKSPDELDPDQTSSVGHTRTALESRAFGLASLFLFGATPIEHVGYDSATRTTTVKLRLPGGANLVLGSDFDRSRELRLRKSLGPHWAIQSEITEQGRQSSSAATFLEWLNRY